MEKAKAAVSDFMSRAGHHDTTVHEKVNPAVVHEHVNPHRHEEVQTAIDKEVHQDHYHTSVQPVKDKEILPEKHTHNLGAVEHRQFDHGKGSDVKARLEAEAAQFKDTRDVERVRETTATAPIIAGEHIHHHVHETIQPVVEKETIQPEVVHTTVPIHEVHHNAAQHHSTSALPAVSMDEFKRQGGVLTGREERYDGFEGEPKSVGGALSGTHHQHHQHHGTTDTTGMTGNTGTTGTTGTRYNMGTTDTTGKTDTLSRVDSGRAGEHNTHGTHGTHHKASLGERLDPRVDADGDGKSGFMS